MSQNVYQFIDVNRVDPAKKPLHIRKIEFVEIYEPFTKQQATAQADRCLDCGNLTVNGSASTQLHSAVVKARQ